MLLHKVDDDLLYLCVALESGEHETLHAAFPGNVQDWEIEHYEWDRYHLCSTVIKFGLHVTCVRHFVFLQGLEQYLPRLAASMREKVGPSDEYILIVDSSFIARAYVRVAV